MPINKAKRCHTELPEREAKLFFAIENNFSLSVFNTRYIPPVVNICHKIELIIRRPVRLKNRFIKIITSDNILIINAAMFDFRLVQLRIFPGHRRMIPLYPAELRPVRTYFRVRIEVSTRDKTLNFRSNYSE